MSTKPKRPRPPVVKTDWVVETVVGKFLIPYDTLEKAVSRATWGSNPGSKTKATIYKRTWRKVDL